MREYGEPGGIYLRYDLDLDRGEYVVTNEGGDELFAHSWESEAAAFCEDTIAAEQRAAGI